MKFVKTEDLRIGLRLAKPIYNKKGVLLYERDSKITAQGIESVKNFGLIGIYILEPAAAYSRDWDYARMRSIADEVGALLMIDMAHPAGLIAAGLLQNPVCYAHIVTSTTHKTLRGPRGGIILMGKDFDNPW